MVDGGDDGGDVVEDHRIHHTRTQAIPHSVEEQEGTLPVHHPTQPAPAGTQGWLTGSPVTEYHNHNYHRLAGNPDDRGTRVRSRHSSNCRHKVRPKGMRVVKMGTKVAATTGKCKKNDDIHYFVRCYCLRIPAR
jgi:hypothetical protein